ncbi:MAG: sigma 54-interacting transcriptional regulator, partial [Candidatus Latescibacteria bacterium]|nr:sigma 54-interacting transcriptional regulator [Candidatus Latescibacterota bacterium]
GSSEEIPVDVRIVSATNLNLEQAISQDAFREDLFYRLNTFTIRIPPLRERPEDIMPLARYFQQRYAQEMRKSVAGFSTQAQNLLEAHGRKPEAGDRVCRYNAFCFFSSNAEYCGS